MKAIFIVPSDYDSLADKGVLHIVRQRDEDNLLTALWTIHPFALHRRDIAIADGHTLVEFGQPQSAYLRFVSWIRQLNHLLSIVSYLRKLIAQESVDFVRSNDPYFCGLLGYAATRWTKAKFCVSLHADYDKMDELDPYVGAPRIFGSRRAAKWLEWFILSRADRILAITRYMADYARRNGAPPSRVALFRHHIDLSPVTTSPKKMAEQDSSVPIIALVSRLSRQKSIADLPAVAENLRSLGVEFQIQVAGDGPERARLESMLTKMGLTRHVRFLGFRSAEQVRDLLVRASASIVFIGGASLVEAAAAESPTVAYDCEWHSELIENGITGFLVPEHDTRAAAQALSHLLRDQAMAKTVGKALRKRVCIEYGEANLLRQRQQAYRDLVSCVS
jgi:glycosyltransferase involved in cell wall biosynthesis